MLYWSIACLLLAVVAGLLGASGLVVGAMGAAEGFFSLFIVFLLFGIVFRDVRRGPTV